MKPGWHFIWVPSRRHLVPYFHCRKYFDPPVSFGTPFSRGTELADWPSVSFFKAEQVKVEPYYGDDRRIGWRNVHIITIDGYGVVGFCEGPV
jgi:hypothetical protein